MRAKQLALTAVLALLSSFGSPAALGRDVTASGADATRVASSVTIAYSNGAFTGDVDSSRRGCVRLRTVRVYRERTGVQDLLIGTDVTGDRGRYRVVQETTRGKFYAKVQRRVLTRPEGEVICRPTRSETIHV